MTEFKQFFYSAFEDGAKQILLVMQPCQRADFLKFKFENEMNLIDSGVYSRGYYFIYQ